MTTTSEIPSSSTAAVATEKIDQLRSLLADALADIAAKTTDSSRCLILSGGVDTCAILDASAQQGITYAGALTVVVASPDAQQYGPDLLFAQAAAQKFPHMRHTIVYVTAPDLIHTYLPPCVQHLECYDGMTLRNSLVVAAAMKTAASLGYTDAIVGDGADELLGGYSFMWGDADMPAVWKEKRDRMCQQWTFATETLANMYGMTSHGPYMAPPLVDWVLQNVEREDCIGTRPIQLVHGGEYVDHATGKLLLRQAYNTVASWRRKDPIEVGSGITIIGHDAYWKHHLSNDDFDSQTAVLRDTHGFDIKTKENLVNFRIFQQCFGEEGEQHPTLQRLQRGQGCVGCCFDIGDSMFCKVCGAYPAQREKTTA